MAAVRYEKKAEASFLFLSLRVPVTNNYIYTLKFFFCLLITQT